MILSDVTLAFFLFFGSIRIVSYLPQIICITRDTNGASAISYTTWLLWSLAHLSTAGYAAINLNDAYLAGVSCVYALCCLMVLSLTLVKRTTHRRRRHDGRIARVFSARLFPKRAHGLVAYPVPPQSFSHPGRAGSEGERIIQRIDYLRASHANLISH